MHLTTVHARGDTRIVFRELRSLAETGEWICFLVVADGKGDADQVFDRGSAEIVDLGKLPANRIGRALVGSWRAARCIRTIRPDVVHIHDPELIGTAMLLKFTGRRVVYDVHEDLPKQVLNKHWIPKFCRRTVAGLAEMVESVAGRTFDAIVCATPNIGYRFSQRTMAVVQNFPILSELQAPPAVFLKPTGTFVYVGGLTELRGTLNMINAIEIVSRTHRCSLEFAGNFGSEQLATLARTLPGWASVGYRGYLTREGIASLLGIATAGLVTLKPTPSYLESYPVKMFEYMSAGLPVIASDFPLWREIVAGAECGLLVDPLDPKAIAAAMRWIIENPADAAAMGKRGRDAVCSQYNWSGEAVKLIDLYKRLAGDG